MLYIIMLMAYFDFVNVEEIVHKILSLLKLIKERERGNGEKCVEGLRWVIFFNTKAFYSRR